LNYLPIFRLSGLSENLLSSVVNFEADVALQQSGGRGEDYDDINLKVPPARGAENWEAGRNPALPPQRWWSKAWRIKPLG
jgi:hypothetical protein